MPIGIASSNWNSVELLSKIFGILVEEARKAADGQGRESDDDDDDDDDDGGGGGGDDDDDDDDDDDADAGGGGGDDDDDDDDDDDEDDGTGFLQRGGRVGAIEGVGGKMQGNMFRSK